MSESIDPFVNYHVQQFAYCSLTTTWCLIGTCILGFRLLGDFDTSVNEAYVNPLSHTFINHDMQYSPIHSFGIHHFKSNLCILLHIYIDRYACSSIRPTSIRSEAGFGYSADFGQPTHFGQSSFVSASHPIPPSGGATLHNKLPLDSYMGGVNQTSLSPASNEFLHG